MKIFILLVASLFFRLIYLGVVPVSLAHDEIDNIIQSYSLKLTGQDINKSWYPTSFLPNDGVMAELAPVINLPALSILPNSIFSAHLTTVILSSIFPIVLVLLLLSLGAPPSVSWLSGWLISISPWHIIFSRTSLEQPTSLFFYTLSWLFLTKIFALTKKKYAVIINSLLFSLSYSLGFFTYHGYKFALPILTIIIMGYLFYENRKSTVLKYLLIPLFVVLGLLLRTYLYQDHYSSRSSEIILTQVDKFAKGVDSDRRISLSPSIVDSIYSNKYIALFDTLKSKYLMTISPELLYTAGEKNGVFSVGRIGYIYLISLPFVIIGIAYLLYHRKPFHILLLCLFLISPIASVIHINNTLAFRSGIYFVLLNVIIAYGLFAAYEQIKSKSLMYLVATLFMLGLSRFVYIYFAIHPTESATAYFFSDRVLGQYLNHNQDKKILVIDSQPRYILSNLILSKSVVTKTDLNNFNGSYSPSDLDSYNLGNIDIVRSCPKDADKLYDTVIITRVLVEGNLDCPAVTSIHKSSKLRDRAIVSPYDSGMEKLIIGDSVCADQDLGSYINPKHLSDFAISSLDRVQFCKKWIVEQ